MRRLVALAIGLVVSTLLLGGGWLLAGLREREGRVREAEARLARDADLVRAALDESLEELRAREDERPFYLYDHYYSPPDVLAITDPVAVSPLARPPTDPRLVGHFQLEPGGRVRTPYETDEEALVSLEPPGGARSGEETARRIREVVSTEAFAPLFALAGGEGGGTLLAGRPPSTAAPIGPAAISTGGELLALAVPSPTTEPAVDEPLTVALNRYGNVQAQDIVAAQSGDPEANARVMDRGRQMPRISRRDVSWEENALSQNAMPQNTLPQNSAAQNSEAQHADQPSTLRAPAPRAVPQVAAAPARSSAAAGPRTAEVRSALEAVAREVSACTPAPSVVVRLRLSGAGVPDGLTVSGTEVASERECVEEILRSIRVTPFTAPSAIVRYAYRSAPAGRPAELEVTAAHGLDNMVQRETEVDYTPLSYREVGDALVLHRVVSHDGVSVVQGVLLDREGLQERWIPSVVERHADGGVRPEVVRAGTGECAVRRPASRILPGVELCFGPAALTALTGELDLELRWQLAALLALSIAALLAAFAILSAARRAEALSRQKSAFVSAVSHELRTPLTTLRMHAEMLDEGMVTDERRPRVHRELVRESVRLARLVDNVLSLSKLEEGQRRLHREEGDLTAHVRGVAEAQRSFVEERGFTLTVVPAPSPVTARFDAQAVEQIVVNLLDNAVKYGAGDEKVIEVEVAQREARPAIVVRDRGPGIPAAERQRVFQRFHRVERPEHAHAPGTGIGLSLVEELAQAHDGSARVLPRAGGGLEVVITLG